MAVMTIWAAVLIIYGVFARPAMDSASDVLPLDMALKSVDDMYDGCKDEMKSKVEKKYLQKEKNIDDFKEAWDLADSELSKAFKNNKLGNGILQKEQAMAIFVYTLETPNIYHKFNAEVRSPEFKDMDKFRYRTLHFYLTEAIKTLNAHQAERCVTTYRGVDLYFNQDVLNKEIRFGSFTSSSINYHIAQNFGRKSCFVIETCYGADISLYSKFGDHEAEVLIPPYEVFKVTKITKKSEDKDLECDVVYTVKSTRNHSYFNCALFKKCSICSLL